MKTKKTLYIALLLIAVVFACRKDFSIDNDVLPSYLTEAKDFYYKQAKQMNILAVGREKSNLGTTVSSDINTTTVRRVTPLWHKSYVSKAGSNNFIEVPLISNSKIITMYNFGKKIANAKINLMRANASFKRLLIYKTKRGNFHQLQLTYVPDYDYLEKNHFDASANQIDKIKDDFSGYIEYSTIKDERKIFILRFEKGKLVGKIQFKSKKELNPGTNAIQNAKSSKAASMSIKEDINVVSSGHFETECIPIMLQPCFEVGDPPVETCGEWIQVGENCDPVWVEDPPEPGDDDPCYDEYNFYICDPENPGQEEPELDSPPPYEIYNNVSDSCLKAMVDSTLGGNIKNEISKLIDSVFKHNRDVHLYIADITSLPNSRDGETALVPLNDGSILITLGLNENILPGATQEYIAATILHEAIHAYFNGTSYDLDQHEEMAKSYVNTMSSILKSMFPGLTANEAKALSWGGLEGTTFFTNPPTGLTLPTNHLTINAAYRHKTTSGPGHGCSN